MAVAAFHVRVVVEAVGGVDPAVEAAAEAGLIAVRVARVIERPVEHLAFVRLAVAVGVVENQMFGMLQTIAAVAVRDRCRWGCSARRRTA